MFNELYHYGVKGMKWGVRRYQNKDGSLTNAGRQRYRKSDAIDANNLDQNAWLNLIDSGRDFVVKRGTKLYRTTTVEHEAAKGKKYVSFRSSDIDIYNKMVADNEVSPVIYDVTYASKKNMKVAGTRTQLDLLQKMYGKKYNPLEVHKEDIERGYVDKAKLEKPISKMSNSELADYIFYNPFGHDQDILNKPITDKNTAKYINELSKKGYDAVVDMADLSIGFSDGPAIVLKTEETLKRKSSYRV